MTNPTPEQMLELAKIVEPDKKWFLEGGSVYCYSKNKHPALSLAKCLKIYKPHIDNDAQLMQVVFALWNKSAIKVETIEHDSGKYFEAELAGFQWGITNSAYGRTKQQAILNLAVEVLCK
jgi:hypothetical protein